MSPLHSQTRRETLPSAHLVGACGAGMRALSDVLCGLGWTVTGSDSGPDSVRLQHQADAGLRIFRGHAETHVPPTADVVVHSAAVQPANPELRAARQLGIPCLSYTGMLGRLMQDRVGIAVAGTHGKSSTTALLGWILRECGLDPTVVVGAAFQSDGTSGWPGSGELFLVESCEYRRGFLDLQPRSGVLLGIENDHFDCFQTPESLDAAFAAFAERVPADGTLFVNRDCSRARRAASIASASQITFSVRDEPGSAADWLARRISQDRDGMRFRVSRRGSFHSDVRLPLLGEHNVANALAAIAVAAEHGADAAGITAGVASFPGLRRRFEVRPPWRGIARIDDYAHHPTAVGATLGCVRRQYSGRRLVAVFEPHQVSRTRSLQAEFAAELAAADRVLIAPIFAARETVDQQTISQLGLELAARVSDLGTPAEAAASLDRIMTTLDHELRAGDVLLTMGAGLVERIQDEFTRRLQRHPAAG